ncbi:hypothetical protein VTL71DRAFT_2418 [Oculimacula yallundae]|uniref:Uncharacterized protein n=1 Tax=Oculimacula yallundae TaxID=86028 RepID=A0ABR4CA12_9HELO
MSSLAPDKENIAPNSSLPTPPSSIADKAESITFENLDGFVEVSLTSNNDQVDASQMRRSSIAAIKLAAEKRKRDALSDEEDKLANEKRMREALSQDDEDEDAQGLRSMESSTDLDDVSLDELMEIERSYPESDLEPPARPFTPFGNRSSRAQDSAFTQPRSYNPFTDQAFNTGLDLSARPAPLQINKSSYFSQDDPMKTDSESDDRDDDTDDWTEEEEVEVEGIRRDEVELTLNEWELAMHPKLGRYRVKESSCLRICETIETDA